MPFQPAAHHLVGTLFLLMLRLGKGEMLARGIIMLIGEDDHQISAGEETGQLFGQTLKGSLVRDGSLAGCYHHKHVVGSYLRGYLGHLVPMGHERIVGKDLGIAVLDKLVDERKSLHTAMELYAAVEVACHARQTFYPAVEAWLKLCSRRNSHLYAAYGVERLADTCHDYLAAESIEQTLMELAPELR